MYILGVIIVVIVLLAIFSSNFRNAFRGGAKKAGDAAADAMMSVEDQAEQAIEDSERAVRKYKQNIANAMLANKQIQIKMKGFKMKLLSLIKLSVLLPKRILLNMMRLLLKH